MKFVDLADPSSRHAAGVVLAQWVAAGGDPVEASRAMLEKPTDADLFVLASAAEDLGVLRLREEGFELTYSDANRTVRCRFKLRRFDLACLGVVLLSLVVSISWVGLKGSDRAFLISLARLFAGGG